MSNVTFYQNVALEKGINVTTSPSHVLVNRLVRTRMLGGVGAGG